MFIKALMSSLSIITVWKDKFPRFFIKFLKYIQYKFNYLDVAKERV